MYKPIVLLALAVSIAAIPLNAKPAGTTPPARLPALEASTPNPTKNVAAVADVVHPPLKRQESNPPPEPASPLSDIPLADVLEVAEGILGGAAKKRGLTDLTHEVPDFSVSGGPLPASIGKRQLGGAGGGLLGALPISDLVQTASGLGPLGTVKGLTGDLGTVESLAGAVKRMHLETAADVGDFPEAVSERPTLPVPIRESLPLRRLDEQPSNITNPGPMNTTDTTNPAQNATMPPPPPAVLSDSRGEGQNKTLPGPQNATSPVGSSESLPQESTEHAPLNPAEDAAQSGGQQGSPLGSFGDITVAQIIEGIQQGIQAIQALKDASSSV